MVQILALLAIALQISAHYTHDQMATQAAIFFMLTAIFHKKATP